MATTVTTTTIKSAIDGQPASAVLLYRMRWLTQFYGGDTVREYPVSLGASEILRRIKCERADRRSCGRIVDELIQID